MNFGSIKLFLSNDEYQKHANVKKCIWNLSETADIRIIVPV